MDAWDELLEEPLHLDGVVIRRWSDLHLLAEAHKRTAGPPDDDAAGPSRLIELPLHRRD
jgi:hypothetical protein